MGQVLKFIAAHLPGHRFYRAYTLSMPLPLAPPLSVCYTTF